MAGFELRVRPKRKVRASTREQCMEACLNERQFECRSVNWYRHSNECTLSDQDRHSVSQSEAGDQRIKASLADLYGPATNTTLTTSGRNGRNPIAHQQQQLDRRRSGDTNLNATTGKRRNDDQPFETAPQLGAASDNSQLSTRQDWPPAPAPASPMALYTDEQTRLPETASVDYLENNCVYEPNRLCEFRKIQNRVLKTVDSIHQDVNSLEECKQKCLNAPYRCYSFDYGDTSERVCRTSHLDQASLLSVKEPYLDVVGAITYELAACFNVSIQCRAKDMVAFVSSNKAFRGKIYAKSRPRSCVNDVQEALQFELSMPYHDKSHCDVRSSSTATQGIFSNDIVIQHHDRIFTTQDIGLTVYCQYDLGNRSVTNNVDLSIEPIAPAPSELDPSKLSADGKHGTGGASLSGGGHSSPLTITGLATTVVRSPNVTMSITNMNGQPVSTATVGDRLALLFEVKEKTSKYSRAVDLYLALARNLLHVHVRTLLFHASID